MSASQHDLNDRLVAAVTARDAKRVRTLLEDGADPDTPGPDALPLLCSALAGFDHESAEALTDGGADSNRELPDGTTPLLRAVDLGSWTLFGAVLGDDPQLRLPEDARKRLLDLARHWFETGEEEELRRRTGAAGPANRRLVNDERYNNDRDTDIEEVCLEGLTVRAGHSAILTSLEKAFGILAPVAELVARGVSYLHPDDYQINVNWFIASNTLGERRSPQDWSDLKALQHHPDPVHRIFLADVVWSRNSMTLRNERQDTAYDAEFLAAWALNEPDGMVLARVLEVYADEEHPGQEAIGLRFADHPDPRVRSKVPDCLIPYETLPSEAVTTTALALACDPDPRVRAATGRALGARDLFPAFREALLTLIRDSDFGVRVCAAVSLSNSNDRTAAVADALASLMDEEDQVFRLEIAFALARRDDPRTEQAYERVGELGRGFEDDHRVSGLWHYRERNHPTEPHTRAG